MNFDKSTVRLHYIHIFFMITKFQGDQRSIIMSSINYLNSSFLVTKNTYILILGDEFRISSPLVSLWWCEYFVTQGLPFFMTYSDKINISSPICTSWWWNIDFVTNFKIVYNIWWGILLFLTKCYHLMTKLFILTRFRHYSPLLL